MITTKAEDCYYVKRELPVVKLVQEGPIGKTEGDRSLFGSFHLSNEANQLKIKT
jgi:hypothetical protein